MVPRVIGVTQALYPQGASLKEQFDYISPAPTTARKRAALTSPPRTGKKPRRLPASTPPPIAPTSLLPVVKPAASAPATEPSIASAHKQPIDHLYDNSISRLGTYMSRAAAALRSSPSWESFVNSQHGPPHLQPGLDLLPLEAATYLSGLQQHGAPVLLDEPEWSPAKRQEAIERGCHFSAVQHKEFIAGEMCDFAEDGFWAILPYDLIKDLPGVRLSPAQIKEEKDRRPRFIADHSYSGVNDNTIRCTAPADAMQFGGAMYRLLYNLRHSNPRHGKVSISKYDVKDGFYRVHLRAGQCLSLCVMLPHYEGLPVLVAVPLVLTMGWTNSPPTFCAVSESICDLAASRFYRRHAPPHRLEELVTDPEYVSSSPPVSSRE